MHMLKKAALGASATLMTVGGSLIALPTAHAAVAPVNSITATRTAAGTCTVKWTDGRSNVFFVIKETDLATGAVRDAVYDGSVRKTSFTFRNGTHRFRYAIQVGS